jgi:photosystem II stability/assembly factor-like uncharacterized protein
MSATRSALLVSAVLLAGTLIAPVDAPVAAQEPGDVALDSALLAGYRWRNLGPDRGGRSIAVSGVVGRADEAYFGAVGGGLWKTTDGGENWSPVTDFKITSASVGAVAVSETEPDLVFIGTGEACIRGNIIPGDGMYRSRDAGETWEHIGFTDTDAISKVRVHPTDPDIVFAAVFGKYGADSEERGVFKSTDGGETWTEITRNPGMPHEGMVGRIGLAVSSANSNRVYALFENDDGGLFRSEDGGDTWELVNSERRIRQRAFYYTHVFADHQDEDVVYVQNTSLFRSTDGGATYEVINNGTHGDFHDFWIDPDDAAHLVVGNDGGGAVSFTTGEAWTDQEFSTSQFYRVVTTAHTPFHVCGSQQDNSTLCLPSDWNAGRFGLGGGGGFGRGGGGDRSITEGSMNVAYRVGGGEPGYIAPDPRDLNIFYSGTNNGRYVDKFNRTTGASREVNPYPWFYSGEPAIDMVERWQWTFPIVFSPLDPNRLYVSSNRLWQTLDGGNTWEALSPDLTRADPSTLGRSGGPITGDMNGPEVYATIFTVAPGKLDVNVIWTGSDDGLVHVTRDGGATWTNITPPDMPDFGRVQLIDASAFEAGRAYMAVKRSLLDDKAPYIWRTDDYGASWTKIVNGIPHGAFVNTVREDPTRPGLLYAGTNRGVYISYDDGAHWRQLNPSLPDIPISSLIVEHDELAVASHGRGFWILDNIAPLRQARSGMTDEDLVLFQPASAMRAADGAILSWWLKEAPAEAKLEIVAPGGEVVRTFEPADTAEEGDRWSGAPLPVEAGLNRLHWDLRTDPAPAFPGMILWGVRTLSATVPPGTYTVRLTADGYTETATLEVQRNPWITDVTDEDLKKQYVFAREIQAKVTEANSAVIAIRRAKVQLEARLEGNEDRALREAAHTFMRNASEVEANIYQVRNRSNQDPLNFPIKVNNRLANLLSMVERGDGAPNEGMHEVFQIMSDRLDGYLETLQNVWDRDLDRVNDVLEGLGMAPVDPWDETTKLEAPVG